ncbi:uncharacterized protein LOC129616266 [Condylostylus longicornis]|uniref:uncharacterized protein LOC129616266 n=1 Tax=Condylostylus longicornis TaxID=2530218 RepID=UPI00244DF881|nr:uncharacterized protein LOC129616266 [Condylostylus longicornis]
MPSSISLDKVELSSVSTDINANNVSEQCNPKHIAVSSLNDHESESATVDDNASYNSLSLTTSLSSNSSSPLYSHAHNNTSDLAFISNDISFMINEFEIPIVKKDLYHPPLLIKLKFVNDLPVEIVNIPQFNFEFGDFSSLNSYLSLFDWHEILNDKLCLKKCNKSRHPPWYNKRLLSLKNAKNNAYRKFKRSSLSAASDIQSTCNLFAKYFESVYEKSNISQSLDYNGDVHQVLDLGYLQLTYGDVYDKISQSDHNISTGPDGIPNSVLKNCISSISEPLLIIFNRSLKEAKEFISPNQHGFVKGRSTSSNLSIFLNSVYNAVERAFQVDAIFTDISKAFDKVDHFKLLSKLQALGFHGTTLKWIRSYLLERKISVKISSCESYSFLATSGFRQGTHLGPLLFLLFTNDCACHIDCSILSFADDTKLFSIIRSVEDCHRLQLNIHKFYNWCSSNGFMLNVEKCKVMRFYRTNNFINFSYRVNNFILDSVDEIKDLGIILDNRLTFNPHIDHVISKAFSMLGFIKRQSAHFSDPYTFKSLFVSSRRIGKYPQQAMLLEECTKNQREIQTRRPHNERLSGLRVIPKGRLKLYVLPCTRGDYSQRLGEENSEIKQTNVMNKTQGLNTLGGNPVMAGNPHSSEDGLMDSWGRPLIA